MTLNEVCQIARRLMIEHKLFGWTFSLDDAKVRAGCCKYKTKLITLSRHYVQLNLDKPDDILDTILHEIAHALAGHEAGHGPAWKAKCEQIGAKPERCYGKEIKMPEGKWRAVCGGCRRLFTQHRRPKPATARRYWYCKKCGPQRGRLDYYRAESIED